MTAAEDFACSLDDHDQAALARVLVTDAAKVAPTASWRVDGKTLVLTDPSWFSVSIAFLPSEGGGASLMLLSPEGVVLDSASVLDVSKVDDDIDLLLTLREYADIAGGAA